MQFNLSLNKKLVLMMLFLSLMLVSILLVFFGRLEKAVILELEKQTSELSKAIQVGVEEVTSTGSTDETRLSQYLNGLKAKGLKEISIISTSDEIIASTNPKKIGEVVSPKKKELIIKAELGEPISEEGKAYNIILPVVAGNEHYGYIHLKINAEDFSTLIKHNAIKRIMATVIVFCIGIIMAMLLSWRYTMPIHKLVDAAKKIAAGDLNQNLTTNRTDEIGELTESFNFMVQGLKDARQIEEKLREAEHLTAVGELARSIAHEIRNPLNFISLSIEHIKKKYAPLKTDDAEKFDSLIASIKQEIQRLNKLVENFLDYGRPLKLNISEVEISKLLEDIVSIIWTKAEAEKVKIVKAYRSLPKLRIDPDLFKTCIFNVILNAFDAMHGGGTLVIRTEEIDKVFILSVKDTGAGISKEDIHKVFDPFFTKKQNGLGLGLALTKRVVEEHGGKVTFLSTVGQGSTVIITLPLS